MTRQGDRTALVRAAGRDLRTTRRVDGAGDGAADPGVGYQDVARAVGWAFAIWGTALYWWAGLLYIEQARRILRRPA